jgi:hypothetical protein
MPKKVLAVESLRRDRVLLLGPFGKRLAVQREKVIEGQHLLDDGLPIQLAIGEDEPGGVGTRRDFQTPAFDEPKRFFDPNLVVFSDRLYSFSPQ